MTAVPSRVVALVLAIALAAIGCDEAKRPHRKTPAEVRAELSRLMPPGVRDRSGWAADIQAAFASLQIDPSAPNLCAVVAVTEQESTFTADPKVPGLGRIALEEIDRRMRGHHIRPWWARRAQDRFARRPHLGAAHRRGLQRARAQRRVRSDDRSRAAGQAPAGELQPRAHRRADAGEHHVRRGTRAVEGLSVSRRGIDPRRGLHPARRHVLRHRAPAGLSHPLPAAGVTASPITTPAGTPAATRPSRTRWRSPRASHSTRTATSCATTATCPAAPRPPCPR